MHREAIDPDFELLLGLDEPLRRLGSGYGLVEGPIWHPTEHYLLFSDVLSGVRRRWDASGVAEVAASTRQGNGMTYDCEFDLLVCE